ncbi:unnamed protein product [Rotaria sp. Silwood1]|nr:unnamed protein product [Rotaria sp. Silwood1]CAF1009260.1 unnamed protein product [Rotaria sp. Silwood1]CAF3413262.1 unnamed protein product [Rotaria sp. Silwood1]CAF3413563.1 unnamed protein product [Rotaria sp. Silwood1]CAF4729195.1 unnamed protein product [Rotaria sp. Silwood1]
MLLFFNSFGNSLKTPVFIDVHKQDIIKINWKSSSIPNIEEKYIFSKNEYLNQTRKSSENVIAFLVASFTGDVRLAYNPYPRLRDKISQIEERLGDNSSTDLIIFHTGYPFQGDLLSIIQATRRQVEFVNVDHIFYRFSPGFDPHIRDPSWSQKGKWNYHHMCYFWFKQVFELKIIQRYRYMMRLDDDSQILGKWPNVFEIMVKHQALYMANQREVDFEYVLPGITLVRNVTTAFISKNKITLQNPAMFADIFNRTMEIPNYWNNFEIVDLSFMRRKEVVDFIQCIDESRGVFLYRWGDAPLRYITLALFVNATQILHRQQLGLAYCHPC